MKTIQEQYNLIKKGKGSKHIFLTEAKKQFPNILTNPMGFNEASSALKRRGVITENYVDLQPINQMGASPKQNFELKFANFLSESSQIYYLVKNRDTGKNEVRSGSKTTNKSITGTYRFKNREEAENKAKELNSKLVKENKAVEKKTTKEVEDNNSNSFDSEDKSNLDNQIGQEVLNGIYFEAKQNPDKDLEEIRKIVSKNLEKDGQYYLKNAAFGVDGIGYEEPEMEEVSGKHKESGYSDKLKKMVKEALLKNENKMNDTWKNFLKKENKRNITEAKKPKKDSVDSKLADIDKQSQIVALEAKIETISEMIESKTQRLSMVSEDENLAELVDKKAIKGMEREIKLLEKRKMKMEKLYEKMCGKSYTKSEIVDEDMEEEVDGSVDEMDEQYNDETSEI